MVRYGISILAVLFLLVLAKCDDQLTIRYVFRYVILVEQLFHKNPFVLSRRVNTFRRLDLIETFMDYYLTCNVVRQVHIVWSDQVNIPPIEWHDKYPSDKYIFELHKTDSLSNRFRVLDRVFTEVC